MATSSPSSEAIEPVYGADDRQDPNFVRVSVAIPGLHVKRKLTTKKKFLPSFVKEAANVHIDPKFEDTSFILTVTGLGNLQGKTWVLAIRQLHHPIVPAECTIEVKEERVLVFLRKVTRESWYPELEEGLDAYDEEEAKRKERKKRKKKKRIPRKKSVESTENRKINDESGEVEEGGEIGEGDEDESESEDDDEEDSDEDEDEEERTKESEETEKDSHGTT